MLEIRIMVPELAYSKFKMRIRDVRFYADAKSPNVDLTPPPSEYRFWKNC